MRKYILILGLFLSLSPSFANADVDVNYVVKDGYSDFTCKFANDTVDLNSLLTAEAKILGQNFNNDSTEKRLSRIESRIFGAIQSGSYNKRMNMINAYSNRCLIASISSSRGSFRPNRGFISRRPYGFNHHHFGYNNGTFVNRFNPFYGYRNGILTGFSPPVNYGYNFQRPYVVNNSTNPFRRFFNPSYNNHYQNNPMYNPYLNGNYNTMQNSKYIPLFNNNSSFGPAQYYNGYGFSGMRNSNSGATVTIID